MWVIWLFCDTGMLNPERLFFTLGSSDVQAFSVLIRSLVMSSRSTSSRVHSNPSVPRSCVKKRNQRVTDSAPEGGKWTKCLKSGEMWQLCQTGTSSGFVLCVVAGWVSPYFSNTNCSLSHWIYRELCVTVISDVKLSPGKSKLANTICIDT